MSCVPPTLTADYSRGGSRGNAAPPPLSTHKYERELNHAHSACCHNCRVCCIAECPVFAVPLFLALRNAETLFRRIIANIMWQSRPHPCAERPSNCGARPAFSIYARAGRRGLRRRGSARLVIVAHAQDVELWTCRTKYLWRPCSYILL